MNRFFFFQTEDGIRGLVRSRGLGDVYKRQAGTPRPGYRHPVRADWPGYRHTISGHSPPPLQKHCLLYKSDADDDLLCVDLGGGRIIKKKQQFTRLTARQTPYVVDYHHV